MFDYWVTGLKMQRLIHIIRSSLILFVILTVSTQAQSQDTVYKLGPGDRFEMRVVVWDDEARKFESWPVFAGSYFVQMDGVALLPLAGEVHASGKSRLELSQDIALALRNRAGLIESPSVSIDIIKYSPIYIVGDVLSPGEYEMRPGLTVAQAHAIAGAGEVSREINGAATAVFRDTGNLRQALGEIARARVQLARLKAAKDSDANIEYPQDITHPDGATALAEVKSAENAIFKSQRAAIELETDTLEGLKGLLTAEVKTLEDKLVGLIGQVELARENLKRLESLVERGISRAAPLLEAQRGLFELESKELDLQNGIYRARQRISEADRDIVALQTRSTADIHRELQLVSAKLEALKIRSNTLRHLIEVNEGARMGLITGEMDVVYTLVRSDDTGTVRIAAKQGDFIQPGDILEIDQVILGE